MTKIDIISGFLGAGKTSFIKKMLKEVFVKEQVVLIENEFGEIGIDGGFLKESGIEIREMNSGCICCSLVGDFGKSLKEVIERYSPDRILIEPSGVGKLSDVIKAVHGVENQLEAKLNSYTTVVDVTKCKLYSHNFGEFFSNQVECAGAIILSRTDKASLEKVEESLQILRELNPKAPIITTPIADLSGERLLETMEKRESLEGEFLSEMTDDHCGHGCGEAHCHERESDCADHSDHCDHHHDHDHHPAEEIFTSWGCESARVYTKEEVQEILTSLESDHSLGDILRAKGMIAGEKEWFYFDMVPGEQEIRTGTAEYTGRICVIGAHLETKKLAELFKINQ